LHGYDYSQNGAYFVTICTQNHRNIFGVIVGAGSARPGSEPDAGLDSTVSLNRCGEIVIGEWAKLSLKYPHIELREFIIMPNHFHGIVVINDTTASGRANPAPTLGKIIAYFKYHTTKMIDLPEKLWQRNYYERVIRKGDEYSSITEYIKNNPQNWRNDKLWSE
jgi:REP element-mobilizing transposase RayT